MQRRLAAELAETYGHAGPSAELHDDDRRDPRQAAANAFVRVPDPRDLAVQMPAWVTMLQRALAAKARSTRPCWILLPRCTGWPTLQASALNWGVNTSPPPA